MIQSMTGFGRAAGALSPRFFVAVTVKSVNHRFLETSVRLPELFWDMETQVRAIASEIFSRGKLDISVRVQRTQQPDYSVRVNEQIAAAVVPRLRQIADQLGLGASFSGGDLLRVPDLLQVEAVEAEVSDEEKEKFAVLVREALRQMLETRRREGEALSADVRGRLQTIRELQDRLAAHRDDVRREVLASFKQRVDEIAAQAGITVDPDRIAQEVVLLVERGDIAEELTRLTTHVVEVERVIAAPEAAGKKLDFLSQEMLREINTMGSKSRSSAIRSLVVELKTELERIREQVQNVE